jgi:hypothetical protein
MRSLSYVLNDFMKEREIGRGGSPDAIRRALAGKWSTWLNSVNTMPLMAHATVTHMCAA